MNEAGKRNRANYGTARAQSFWRRRGVLNVLLLPLAAVFVFIAALRKIIWQKFFAERCDKPLIIVGGVTVGGGGKTPVVIALADALRRRGFRVGIVSRGYGGGYRGVTTANADNWRDVGDEAALMAKKTACRVCVSRRRIAAARRLAADCDIIVSDDGLQHYAMHRDIEICVVHGDYQFGNGMPLPAGPMRESRRRAAACDFLLVVGGPAQPAAANKFFVMREFERFYALRAPHENLTAAFYREKKVVAVAGIAHPDSFFSTLEEQGVTLDGRIAPPDHGRLSDAALANIDADVILMSEKDAIKYPAADSRLHAAAIRCVLPDAFLSALAARLSAMPPASSATTAAQRMR